MWGLSVLWAIFFFWTARDLFGTAWNAEGSFLNIFTAESKPIDFLTGIGAATVGCLPLLLTYGIHRFHKGREHSRLTKERTRIDKRIDKLDAKKSAGSSKSEPVATSDS